MSYNEVTSTYHCDLCQEFVNEDDFVNSIVDDPKKLDKHFCCDEHYDLWRAAN